MNAKFTLDTALCLILTGGMWVGALLPATATAREPKRPGKAEKTPLPPEGQELDVKAADLAKVTYQGPAQVQAFIQSGPKRWRSAGLSYDEVERDEFSVYLIQTKTENERVQIDLHTRKVTFTGKNPEASYPILSASSAKPK